MRGSREAWIDGVLGMLIFSASMPATRAAVVDFPPLFLTAARAALPGVLALAVLIASRSPRPIRADWPRLALVALGVVLGFPLFASLALTRITAAHSLIWIGLLPLSTATFGVWLAGERMRPAFWGFSALGAACVVGFAASRAYAGDWQGDALMLGAVLSAGFGYTEGARLTRRLGGWQVISWALVVALPFSLALSFALAPNPWPHPSVSSWFGFFYVALFAMWIGFIFWYRALALGGIAAIGQLQLLQPFFGLIISWAWLGERIDAATIGVAAAVLVCVAGARRASMAARR